MVTDTTSRKHYPSGWSRGEEIDSARKLFEGYEDGSGRTLARAERVTIEIAPFDVVPDSTVRDTLRQYRVVRVPYFRLAVSTESDLYRTGWGPCDLYVVRGDAASLGPGQPALSTRWYLRKCVEKLAPTRKPVTRPSVSRLPDSLVAYTPFGIESVYPLPCRDKATFRFILTSSDPASIDLLDSRGRILLCRELESLRPGRHELQLALGDLGSSGLFWVRLRQSGRQDVARFVRIR